MKVLLPNMFGFRFHFLRFKVSLPTVKVSLLSVFGFRVVYKIL